jgi:hypothetical protein
VRGAVSYGPHGIGGTVERRVVNDDRNAVPREVDVAFEAVAPERHPVVEGRQRILGRKLRTAAMGEDQADARREGMLPVTPGAGDGHDAS